MTTRQCRKCGETKPLDTGFYRSRQWFLKMCKDCRRKQTREQKRNVYDPEKNKIKSIKRRLSGKTAENFERMTRLYPQKYKARYTFRNAVRLGKIKKQPCAQCGEKKAQGHHPDYSKPFDVIWLCLQHHKEQHRIIQSPPTSHNTQV